LVTCDEARHAIIFSESCDPRALR